MKKLWIVWLIALAMISVLILPACEPAQVQEGSEPEKVHLSMSFSPGDTLEYRVVTEKEQAVDFEGSRAQKDEKYQDDKNASRLEVRYRRTIKSVDAQGNATAEVTIEAMKLGSIHHGNPVFNYDSTEDKPGPLKELIGKSYTLILSPRGESLGVQGLRELKQELKNVQSYVTPVKEMVERTFVLRHHGMLKLPDDGAEREYAPGESWSSRKTFHFPKMGAQVFERRYTVEDVQTSPTGTIVKVAMVALPGAPEDEKQTRSQLAKMFDNQQVYTGELLFDSDRNQVVSYKENLSSEWTVVDPSALNDPNAEPTTLTLKAVRNYMIEVIE